MSHFPSRRPPATWRVTSVRSWLAQIGVGLLAVAGPCAASAAPRSQDADSAKSPTAATQAEPSPLIAIVSIGDQHVTIWAGDTMVTRAPVSTGMDGHRTPLGVFSVIGKERYHESNIYSGAPMPFMQRITWSGVAMHAGNLPGYPASHGCIRMPEGFAERLYGMTRVGMRVIVTSHDLSPAAVINSALFAPIFVHASQFDNRPTTGAAGASGRGATNTGGAMIPVTLDARMQLGGPTENDRLLNPMERGKLEREHIKMAAQQAQLDVDALVQIAADHSEDARNAANTARAAFDASTALRQGLEKAKQVATDPAIADADRAHAESARATLEISYVAAVKRAEELHKVAEAVDTDAFRAAAEAKQAMAEHDELAQAARVADHATEPVSVFVSRKEHRVFVRQGFEPVFDADVDIADPDAPIGTHVFTAVAAPSGTGAMRWVSLTVPGTPPRHEDSKGRQIKVSSNVSAPASLPPTAANALSRIKFSSEVMRKISEKLWTGASLIVSDYGISGETGQGTDFVVLTR